MLIYWIIKERLYVENILLQLCKNNILYCICNNNENYIFYSIKH